VQPPGVFSTLTFHGKKKLIALVVIGNLAVNQVYIWENFMIVLFLFDAMKLCISWTSLFDKVVYQFD
jgi:hypothetical protein